MPALTLHVIATSHPCMTAREALRRKGLDFEEVTLAPGKHVQTMQEIYGEGHSTVPGLMVEGEPVHGSRAILARLEELAPDPPLYPAAIADEVREAERWGDTELQDLGRRLPWGALHFRPEALGTYAGAPALDPPGSTSRSPSRAEAGDTRASQQSAWPRTWPASRRSSTTWTSSSGAEYSVALSPTPRTSRSARP